MQPTGLVTFLFTDIEGSTRHWESEPEAMRAALSRHDAILREAIEGHGGYVVKTTGDGAHAVFDVAAEAVRAAISAQKALIGETWPTSAPVKVRMALHTGEAQLREGDYYGQAVNRAARLMSIAAGGQILLSLATAELTRDEFPASADLLDVGRHRLKGLARLEQVYQLTHPDLPSDFPLLKMAGLTPHNLPEQLTSFIGREREVKRLIELLAPDQRDDRIDRFGRRARLITLIGPGGTGKTRLSLHVARRMMDGFPDGVWLVELAPIADPRLIVPSVAAPLGLEELPGRPLLDRLADTLGSKRLLIIMDNCEHLIDECARVVEALLRASPQLVIVASSREALGVPGENVVRVRSLNVPPEGERLTPDDMAAFDAVRLFVERARAVRAAFTLTVDNVGTVAQICRRLDGIPLAIELAASRIRLLTPEQIAARLDDRFRLLTGGSRTALPRQRTLLAMIDWSYDLLSQEERLLLQRLSVFTGGWTLESAEEVAGVDPIEPFEVLDLLDRLVGKSLVTAEEDEWGARYNMLETIRQYAQEKLAESGEAITVRDRQLAHFVNRSQVAFKALERLESVEIADRLAAEGGNLRTARAWAEEHDLLSAYRLMAGHNVHWNRAVPAAEALRFAETIIELAQSDPRFSGPESLAEGRRLMGAVLANAGNLAFGLGFTPRALDYARRAMEIAQAEGDLSTLAWALGIGGTASGMLGDFETSKDWLKEAHAVASESGNRYIQAMDLVSFNPFYQLVEDLKSLPEASENDWSDWNKGLSMFQRAGFIWGQANAHMAAAGVTSLSGDIKRAIDHAERALALINASGDEHQAGRPLTLLAEVARQRGQWNQAVKMYLETLRIWQNVGQQGGAARCLECLAFVAEAASGAMGAEERSGFLEVAATLLGAAEAIRESCNSPMNFMEQEEHEREAAAVQEALGGEVFQRAWNEGQRMTLGRAILFATEALEALR